MFISLLILAACLAAIFLCDKLLISLHVMLIKKKIEKNPLIGQEQDDQSYSYKEKGVYPYLQSP